MTVNRTTLLDLPLPVTGTESGTWGDTTNNGLTQYLDIAIAGTLVLSTDADVTLTSTEGDSSATNIGATTAQYAILRWTATGSTTRNITALAQSKTYVVINATGGTQSIVLRGAGPTTGVTIISGEKAHCVWNGSDFVKVSSSAAAGGSNTQVQYNSSGVLTGSSNLTFDGTNLGLGTGTPTGAGGRVFEVYSSGSISEVHLTNSTSGNTGLRGLTHLLNGVDAYAYNRENGAYIFGVNNTEAMRLTSTGLGIGTSSPSQKLTVVGNALVTPTGGWTTGGVATQYFGDVYGSIKYDYNTTNFLISSYGSFSIATNGTSPTTRLTVDSSGNLGLGVTPSAWSVLRALDIASTGGFFATTAQAGIANNAFFNGTNWIYKTSTNATFFRATGSAFEWHTAPSGTAGNAITFTQAMTLDASGNLGIGTSSPGYRLTVAGPGSSGNCTISLVDTSNSNKEYRIDQTSGQFRVIESGVAERLILTGGNLGLGVTPSAWSSAFKAFQFGTIGALAWNGSTDVYLSTNYASIGGVSKYIANGYAALYGQSAGTHAWYTAPSGTAGNAITFTQAMALDASGRWMLGTTSPFNAIGASIQSQSGTWAAGIHLRGPSVSNGCYFAASTSSTTTDFEIWNEQNGYLRFATNNTERARITSGGYFKASNDGTYLNSTGEYHEFRSNITAANGVLFVHATSASATSDGIIQSRASRNTTDNTFYAFSYYNDAASAYKFRIADSGNATNTNGSYGTISDAKMKTDIVDAGSQWADIKAIRFRKFKMKDDPSGLVQLGVVAQELEQTSPGLVDEHVDRDAEGNDLGTTTKSVKTSILLMKAAKALQEAMTRIETLEAKVSALEGN